MVAPSKVHHPTASPGLKTACACAMGRRPGLVGRSCPTPGHRTLPPLLGYNGNSAGHWFAKCHDCDYFAYLMGVPTPMYQEEIDTAREVQEQAHLEAKEQKQKEVKIRRELVK
ncbi:hypothetical protein K439DRAFT_1610700 [Ramaria rubella]|nr:hypothetical protein K439DRAFT_1610700 [Ramaria rubella]